MIRKLNDYFKNGKAYIWKENFAIVKLKKSFQKNIFAIIKDKNEITAIVEESKLPLNQAIEIQKDYKIFTFDMKLPFGLIGFLAKITKALAEKRISIFVISAYSTDHILVKKRDVKKAIKVLENLGFKIKMK